jgi:S1-C subfamily serine protease
MTTPKTTSTFSFPMLSMLVLHALLALAWSLPSVVTAPRAHAQELTESRRVRIARRLAQSTVSVISGPSTGSGFVVGDERWVITNHHVVESARLGVQVRFGSGTTLQARVIRLDPSHDLAILEVVGGRVPSPPLDLANSDDVEVGQTVLAFGSPFGLEGTLTEGIVSARRDVPDVGGGHGAPAHSDRRADQSGQQRWPSGRPARSRDRGEHCDPEPDRREPRHRLRGPIELRR